LTKLEKPLEYTVLSRIYFLIYLHIPGWRSAVSAFGGVALFLLTKDPFINN